MFNLWQNKGGSGHTIHHCKINNSNTNITDKDTITCLTTECYVEDNELVADVIDSESPKEDDDNPDTIAKGITDLVDIEAIDTNKCLRDDDSDPS